MVVQIKTLSMVKFFSCVLLLSGFVFFSCNRTISKTEKEEEEYSSGDFLDNSDPSNITESEPFRNQPNEFCTIIRKMEVELYAPEKKLDENKSYPKKYCLLDVCLDKITNDGLIINLGDSTQTANATYAIIKIFETVEETRAYENKFAIKDVLYEEE